MGSLKPPAKPGAGRPIEDPYFQLPEASPFSAGSGPFRIKGWGYTGDVRYYDEFVPGGCAAVARAVKDEVIGAFLLRRFEPDAWYDVVPKLYHAQAAAKLRGVMFTTHCHDASRWHAADKFSGIYRPLLRVASPELLSVWVPRLSSSFYDFGATETNVLGSKLVRVTRHGVPRIAVQWWAAAATGYFEYVIAATGARHPHVRWHEAVPDGERLGMELVTMPFDLTWA